MKKSDQEGIDGVELDVRFAQDQKEVVVSHDPVQFEDAVSLHAALEFLKATNLEVFIEIKEAAPTLPLRVGQEINRFELADRSHIFAFRSRAQHIFDVDDLPGSVGAILPNPLTLHQDINHFSPDIILLGFDHRWWTRWVFWAWWSPTKISNLIARYPNIDFVLGVINKQKDLSKAIKINDLYGITTDRPKWCSKMLKKAT